MFFNYSFIPCHASYCIILYSGIENAISPWHDIPLYAEESSTSSLGPVFNYVNEIPKGTTAKYEIATKEESTPIKQDVKNGKLR